MHPAVVAGAHEFTSGFEEGTLRFFDVVLPHCDRMIDCGAYIGFAKLSAAGYGVDVNAFEPSALNFQFLSLNVNANPALASRIKLNNHGIGTRDEQVTLYEKGYADSGSSTFQVIERGQVITARAGALVELHAAEDVLRGVGLDSRTLLKIDIEGGEYAVLPSIAGFLVERKPWLHVSFHARTPSSTARRSCWDNMPPGRVRRARFTALIWSHTATEPAPVDDTATTIGGQGAGPVDNGTTTTVRRMRFRLSAVSTIARPVLRISDPWVGSRLIHQIDPRQIDSR